MASKFDKAVSRARGESSETAMVKSEPVDLSTLQGGDIAGYMGYVSTGDIANRLAKGAKAPVRIMQSEDVQEGAAFAAIVEKFEDIELPSKKEKGKMDKVKAWTFTMLRPHPDGSLTEGGESYKRWVRGARVSIVGGFQMDRQCSDLLGKESERAGKVVAAICRGGTIKTRSDNNMNEWYCPEIPVRDIAANPLVESLSE